jgi:hypothetical protein
MPARAAAPARVRHLTQEDLSERLNVPVETLRDWRRDGKGPDYIKGEGGSNATVRYPLAWVEEWELSRRQRMANA